MPAIRIGPAYTNRSLIKNVTSTITDVLTVPVNYSVHVYKGFICNKTDRDDITITIMIWLTSINQYVYLFKDHPIKNGQTFELWGINLQHGDVVRCQSNVSGTVDISLNYHLFDRDPIYATVLKSERNSVGAVISDSETLFYQEALDKVSDIHDLFLVNTTDDDLVFVDLIFENADNNRSYILKNSQINKKDYKILENITMNAGDKLYISCNKPNSVTAFANKLHTLLS